MKPTIARCEENVIHEEEVQAAQATLISGLEATYLSAVFQALSDPTRLQIGRAHV